MNSGNCRHVLTDHTGKVYRVAWSPSGRLASASVDNTVRLWNPTAEILEKTLTGHTGMVLDVAWSPDQTLLASSSSDHTIRLWDAITGELRQTLSGHYDVVFSVAWSPANKAWSPTGNKLLASCGSDRTLRLWEWDGQGWRQTNVLEGHTQVVIDVGFSTDGRLLASKSRDHTVRLWRCDSWWPIAILDESASPWGLTGVAFHPRLADKLATLGEGDGVIRLWELNRKVLMRRALAPDSVRYATAKIVLLGDSGVGKTGLGWRLAHGEFKEQPSTHGQQFWMLDALQTELKGETECEAVLWDLAGQQDYRLIHALFLDDAYLALLLFDPTERLEPLRGVEYWLRMLSGEKGRPICRTILVGARLDRGSPVLTTDEIEAFCRERQITGGYAATSAFTGAGLDQLIERIKEQIDWTGITAMVTTGTFRRIKQHVLDLKADPAHTELLTDFSGLRRSLETAEPERPFSDDELITAVGHLDKHGFAKLLRTATGDHNILLAPEVLNNLASSFVLEARRNPKDLGALDEKLLFDSKYNLSEITHLVKTEQDILLNAVTTSFLKHNICFRESLGASTFLIFPSLINHKKPPTPDKELEEDMSYTASGTIENVYATLVVLLGYTSLFIRTEQFQNQAEYRGGQFEVDSGQICGFRQIEKGKGEIELVLYYGKDVPSRVRQLFQGLVEQFLAKHDLIITRYQPVICNSKECHGYHQKREEVIRRIKEGYDFLCCSNCGRKIRLSDKSEKIVFGLQDYQLKKKIQQGVTSANLRTRFETALVHVNTSVESKGLKAPICFISYARGNRRHEYWVEKQLAVDLSKTKVEVLLDRWLSDKPGTDIPRFIEQLIDKSDAIIVVGTPAYLKKHKGESFVAAEMDLINQILTTGTNEQKESILPLLLAGNQQVSLPPFLRGKAYADFRREEFYFASLFDLILTLYKIPFDDPAVIDLRDSLRPDR